MQHGNRLHKNVTQVKVHIAFLRILLFLFQFQNIIVQALKGIWTNRKIMEKLDKSLWTMYEILSLLIKLETKKRFWIYFGLFSSFIQELPRSWTHTKPCFCFYTLIFILWPYLEKTIQFVMDTLNIVHCKG